jgi:hypothetical protein
VVHFDPLGRELVLAKHPNSLFSLGGEDFTNLLHRYRVHLGVDGVHEIMTDIGEQATKGGRDAGLRRDQHARRSDLCSQLDDVGGTRATEPDEREPSRVMASIDGDPPYRASHLDVRNSEDAQGCVTDAEPEPLGDLLSDSALGRRNVDMEPLFSTELRLRV